MPQVTNRQLLRDINNTPVGRGTVYNTLLRISASMRERAAKANESEVRRLKKVFKILDKNRETTCNVRDRVIHRTSKSLKELQSFGKVMKEDYTVEKFVTMKPGFDLRRMQTPASQRRVKIETRFYHSGFDQKCFRPEIEGKLRAMDPEEHIREWKKRLLSRSRQESNFLIDRHMTTSAALARVRQRHKSPSIVIPGC